MKLLTVAGLTIREVFNKKICYIVLALTIVFLSVYGIALHYSWKEMGLRAGVEFELQRAIFFPQMFSIGMYFSTWIVALMAIFSAVGAVSSEIETGTIQAVIPKPISRRSYIIGKLTGYGFMMAVYAGILYLAMIFVTYYFAHYRVEGIFSGLASFMLIPIILVALGVCGSVLFSTMANGVILCMLFIFGTVGGMLEQIGAILKNTALVNTGIVSSLLIPTDAVYREMISGLLSGPNNPINVVYMNPFASMNPPSRLMICYAVAYVIFFVFAAVRVFNKTDI